MRIFDLPKQRPARDLFLLGFLTVLLLLPFINKAISLDGGVYVAMGRNLLTNPLQPYDYLTSSQGRTVRQWDISNNPPAVCYIVAGAIRLFGEKEIPLHAVFYCLAAVAVLAMYLLAQELGIAPLLSALLLLTSPAFFVNATDIMLDIPLLAFSLAGIWCIICGERKGSTGLIAAGWTLLGIAALAKFTAVLFIPVVLAWLFLHRRPWPHYLFALIPAAFVGGWCLHNLHFFGETQLFGKSQDVGFWHPFVKEIPLLTYIGGSLLFPPGIFFSGIKLNKWCGLAGILLFVVADLFFNLLKFPPFTSMLLALFLCAGALFLSFPVTELRRTFFDKSGTFIAVWFYGYVLFYAVTSSIIAVRYLLTLLPAAVLLFVKVNENRKQLLLLTVAANLLLSLFIAQSDYRWAGSYRDMAELLKKKYQAPVFFTGYFGFQYYMEKAGFTPVESKREAYPDGTLIVTPVIAAPQTLPQAVLKRMVPDREIFATTGNPFRTIAPECQAGFHLNLYGLLPYSFSAAPLEKFTVYFLKNPQ
jgi:4-amino-4-deoxy-L-arabinose transferase-like glycosyltransferase